MIVENNNRGRKSVYKIAIIDNDIGQIGLMTPITKQQQQQQQQQMIIIIMIINVKEKVKEKIKTMRRKKTPPPKKIIIIILEEMGYLKTTTVSVIVGPLGMIQKSTEKYITTYLPFVTYMKNEKLHFAELLFPLGRVVSI